MNEVSQVDKIIINVSIRKNKHQTKVIQSEEGVLNEALTYKWCL